MATQLPDGVRLLRTLTGPEIGRIGWSPDGRLLAAPSWNDTVCIWDTASGARLRTIRDQRGSTLAPAFDQGGRILITGGSAGISLWDVDSGKLRHRLASGSCYAVAVGSHGRIVASANDERLVTLWELPAGSMLCRIITGSNVRSVAFNGAGSMLATGGDADGTIRLWAIPSGQRLRELDGHPRMVESVAFHPGGPVRASTAPSDYGT
jgi:WD40 repeat protein